MRRFVVGPDLALSPEQRRQIASVLRLGPGDEVVLVAGGEEVRYRLDRVSATAVEGTVIERRRGERESRLALTLALPLLRGEHSEQAIESATQLGVVRFVPYVSARSVVRELAPARRRRWQRIAAEAVETSGRTSVPEIAEPTTWDALFNGALSGRVIVAWEEERALPLLDALRDAGSEVALVIGPEGGLTPEEVDRARVAGATVVSLGRRPLRAETAAVAAVAVAMAALDR